MKCTRVQLPGGATAIICTPKPRARRCSVCGNKTSNVRLCDYVVKKPFEPEQPDGLTVRMPGKTCDAVLCYTCSVHQDPDSDYCPHHAAALGIGGRRLRL